MLEFARCNADSKELCRKVPHVTPASCRLSRGRLALGGCGRDAPGACPELCPRRVRAGRPHDSRRDGGATLNPDGRFRDQNERT